jgi:alkylhydroperoxidase family enzyme
MRIPDWTPTAKPQPQDLVDAVKQRRGGRLLELDHALMWSEPIARGWNLYMGNVRTQVSAARHLCELGILVVARLTGADYEYKHHAPVFLAAGGKPESLTALDGLMATLPRHVADPDTRPRASGPDFGAQERAVIDYAVQVTLDVRVTPAVFAALQAQFDTTQIVEITTTIAAYNMVARVLVPLQVGH